MAGRALKLDLGLLREGLSIGWEFGGRSLIELGRVAEFIEKSVYSPGSLVRGPDGIRFTLLNPPLRLGAFKAIRLLAGGSEVDPGAAEVRTGRTATWRTLGSVDGANPLELLPGIPTDFRFPSPEPVGAELQLRLELVSVAIPPTVWMEFRDRISPSEGT